VSFLVVVSLFSDSRYNSLTLLFRYRTYQLLPGIAIGDIGKKMGRDGIDNGWM